MCEKANANVNEIDILGRDEFVDNCKILIDTIFSTTKSAFIMIDGEWGVGKTFVMNMLDKYLKNEYTVIKYNCWENSYYNDPLEAILSVMLDYIDDNSLWSNANKEKFRALGMVALNLLSLGSVEILNKAVDNAKEYIGENKNSIYTIIQEVKNYINSNEEKIIILVDEIDRCLPEYGVKTLERLYLLFKDAPNFVIVIANDKSRMELSVKSAFGYKSIENYLEKFIDYTLKLDTCKQLKNDEAFTQKYSDYLNGFELYGNYWRLCNVLFSHKNIRHIDKVINKANKLHTIIFEEFEENEITDYILMAELIIIELQDKGLNIYRNGVILKDDYPLLLDYTTNLIKEFKINVSNYMQEYKCFKCLNQLSGVSDRMFDKVGVLLNRSIIRALKHFYDLSLIIE